MAGPLAIFAAVTTVASALGGASAASKSSKAQKRANEAQRKINTMKNKQAKRQFLRQFRQAQAGALMSGIAGGVGLESSRVQGARASNLAQGGTAMREFAEMNALGGEMTSAMNAQSKYNAQAAAYGAVGQFASQFIDFGTPGGDGDVDSPGKEPIGRGN